MLNDFVQLMRVEWIVTILIFLLLFLQLGKVRSNSFILSIVYISLTIGIVLGLIGNSEGRLFASMFVSTKLIAFQKVILIAGTLLLLMLNHEWLVKHRLLPELLMLMLSALLGMLLMISSGNLLIFYLGLELSAIPVAALVNFDLEKRKSSEGAMKMILSSAFSSGILLFGISLFYGVAGTLNFSELATQLSAGSPLQVVALIFFIAGLGFKLSIVPYHLWTADVYEGAPIVVASFLSVISKASVAFIAITFLFKVFQAMGAVIYPMLVVLSILTLLVGNLFALRQSSIKRFLAFSSIAQVGFIVVGISSGSIAGSVAVTYFIIVYLFSNLAAFGVLSLVEGATGSESFDAFRGLYANNKFLSWVMAIALFSLAGIPPTAGFFGKFFLIMSGAGRGNVSVLFITVVALNMVISLYYYLKLVRVMFSQESTQVKVPIGSISKFALGLCVLAIVVIGFIGDIYEYIKSLH